MIQMKTMFSHFQFFDSFKFSKKIVSLFSTLSYATLQMMIEASTFQLSSYSFFQPLLIINLVLLKITLSFHVTHKVHFIGLLKKNS